MDFSKVKLVVTDMDGTLLNSKGEVSKRFFNIYNELKKTPNTFCCRKWTSIPKYNNKFDAIKNEITIIAENGGIVKQGNQELLLSNLTSEIL
jgi:hypothetical protein